MLERKNIILYLHPKIIRVPANSYKKPTLVVERGNLMLYTNKQENNLGRARFHLLAVQVIQGILEDLHVFDANGSVVLEFPICPHLCMTLETVAEVHPSIGCFWHEYFWAVFWGVRMGWGGCWCYAAELLVTTNRSKPEAMQRKIRVRQWKTGWEGKIGLLLTQWLSCFSSEKTGAAPIMVKSHGLNFSRSCYISAISFRPQSTCLKQRLRNVWSITGGDEVKSRSKGACLVVSSGERLRVSSLSLSQSVSQSVSLSVCLSVSLSLQCNRLHLRICMQAHFSVLPVLQCHRFAHAMGWGVMTSQETLHADTCLTTHCSKRCFCNALSSSIFSSGHNMWKFKQRSTHTHSRNIPISSNFNKCQIYISKLFWGVWGVNHA